MRERISAEFLRQLTVDAVRAASEAGVVVMDLYQETTAVEVKLKADSTPRTKADKKADDVIRKSLLHTFIPLLSEEGRKVYYDERRDWNYFWLVDPLDGTKEFINTIGEFTINIALVEEGEAIVGVVLAPVAQRLYYAVRGEGAFCAERFRVGGAIKESLTWEVLQEQSVRLPLVEQERRSEGGELVVVLSRSHLSDKTREYLETLRAVYSEVREVECGSSLKMCMVAEGTADLYPRVNPTSEWDTAAGQAIVEMAGMEVVDFSHFGRLEYNKESLLNPPFVVRRRQLKIPKLA